MAIVSKSTGPVVLLTMTAVFLVTISLTKVWYHVGSYEYAIDYYSSDGYYWFEYGNTGENDPGEPGSVMLGQELIASFWFIAAMVFISLCLVESQRLSLVAGLVLGTLSAILILHFLLRFPDSVGVPGLFGTIPDSYDRFGHPIEYNPHTGFAIALVASVVQISAVLIRGYDLGAQRRLQFRPAPVISLDGYKEEGS